MMSHGEVMHYYSNLQQASSAPSSWMIAAMIVVLLLLISGCFAHFDVECPPQSSQRPANLNLTQPHCNYYVAMAPNENNKEFLDIYLEGSQVGWVAVGFSLNKRMAYSDVVGCKQDSDGNVGIIDSWNGALPPNKIDPTQEGMCNYSSSYVDGKFSCYFSRYHGILNPDYDYDFNGTYYFLLGCSQLKSDLNVNFPFHEPNFPAVSTDMYNPYTFRGSIDLKPQLNE